MSRMKEFLIEIANANGLDPWSDKAFQKANQVIHDMAYSRLEQIVRRFRFSVPVRDGKLLQDFVVEPWGYDREGEPFGGMKFTAGTQVISFYAWCRACFGDGSITRKELNRLLGPEIKEEV